MRAALRLVVGTWLVVTTVHTRRAYAQAVSFDDVIALANRTPRVRATRAALSARVAGDAHIGDLTSPTRIYLMPGIRAFSDESRGFEGQIQIGQTFNLAGLAGARRSAAREERHAIMAEVRTTTLTEQLGAAQAWLILHAFEQRMHLAQRELQNIDSIEQAMARALEVGIATRADVAEAQAFRAEVRLRALSLEGKRFDARVALASAMGRSPSSDLVTEGDAPSPDLPEATALEAALAQVDRVPEVVRRRLLVSASSARRAEASASFGPQLHADAIAYRESPSGLLLFGQLGFDIPFEDLGARTRAVLDEEEMRLQGDHDEAVLLARRDAAAIAHEVEHARETERQLRNDLVPTLEALVESRESMLSSGEGTVFWLLDARRRALEARGLLVEVAATRAWAEVRARVLLTAIESEGRSE